MEKEIEITEENFDYFNSDLKQLIMHILLEGYFRGQGVFKLDQFLKGDYWKINEISEEIRDTNDFGSVESMVLEQVFNIVETFELGKIRRVSVEWLSSLLELAMKKAMNIENPTDEDIGFYTSIIDDLYDLKKQADLDIHKAMEEKRDWHKLLQRVEFEDYERASKLLPSIAFIAPDHIELEISFFDETGKELQKTIDSYLQSFSQDDYIEDKPNYREKRYYFSKQLENFYNYIKVLPVINGSVNIPFSVLREQGFEVVKIISYLENEKKIKVRNWNDVDMWNVKFHTQPITLESLVVEELKTTGKKIIKEPNDGKIKKITIARMNNGKHLVAVNENYAETKEIKDYSEWWQIFIKEVEERFMSNRTNIKEIPKAMADYFNYNNEKCPIYMGGKYELTEIFTGRGVDIMINPDIKTELISEKQFMARKSRQTKK